MSARIRQALYTSAVKCGFIANSNNRKSRRQVAALLLAKIVVVVALATFCHKLLIATSRHYAFVRSVGGFGSGNGQFNWPHGIAADASGNIWVADTYNARLQQFTSDGKFSQAIGIDVLTSPCGVAIDPSGNVWATDTFTHRVHEFTSSGTFLGTLGQTGGQDGQFRYPAGIAADSSGNIWMPIQSITGSKSSPPAVNSSEHSAQSAVPTDTYWTRAASRSMRPATFGSQMAAFTSSRAPVRSLKRSLCQIKVRFPALPWIRRDIFGRPAALISRNSQLAEH
jgi:hypothetical protein